MPQRLITLLLPLLLLTGVPARAADEPAAPVEPDEIALFVQATVPADLDPATAEASLRDAGDNWRELAAALSGCTDDPMQLGDMLWLINNAPHLDRLELRSAMLLGNLQLARQWCGAGGYAEGSEFYRRYILNYRIDDEPVTDWRSALSQRYALDQLSALTPREAAAQLIQRVASGFRTQERGYFGNLADPLAVDNARAGTGRELSLLSCAVLRSQGYATRFVSENLSGESWVEVYEGTRAQYQPEAWFPVYPQAPEHSGESSWALPLCGGRIAVVTAGDAFGREQVTGRYTELAGLRPGFSQDGHRVADFEHWTVSAWYKGDWVPLDDLGYPTADADYPLTLGPGAEDTSGDTYYLGAPGDYRLQAGIRYPGGTVHLVTHDFSVLPGGLESIELKLDTPLELPDEALRERGIATEIPAEFAWINDGVQLWFIHDDAEPSIRTALLVQEFDRRSEISFHSEKWENRPAGWEKPADYRPELLRDVLMAEDGDARPVVILMIDGELRLYLRGYNLNVADWIRRQLEETGHAEVSPADSAGEAAAAG